MPHPNHSFTHAIHTGSNFLFTDARLQEDFRFDDETRLHDKKKKSYPNHSFTPTSIHTGLHCLFTDARLQENLRFDDETRLHLRRAQRAGPQETCRDWLHRLGCWQGKSICIYKYTDIEYSILLGSMDDLKMYLKIYTATCSIGCTVWAGVKVELYTYLYTLNE